MTATDPRELAMQQALATLERDIPRRPRPPLKMSLRLLRRLMGEYQIQRGDPDEGCFGSAKHALRQHFAAYGIDLQFDIEKPVTVESRRAA